MKLFAPEGSAEGCASGECLPAAPERDDEPPTNAQQRPATERWAMAVDAVRVALPRLGKSLSFGRMVAIKDGEVRVAFARDAGFHRATVFGSSKGEIEAAISQKLGTKLRLVEEKADGAFEGAGRSVAESEAEAKFSRERSLDAKLRQSPAVLSVLKVLGGSIEHVQVLDPAPPAEAEAPVAPDDDA